jgi:exonuclease III
MDNDIILLCDLRLNADADHIEKIKKLFLYNKSRQYDFFHHSSKNSRGVGILLSRCLNYSVSRSLKDDNDNIFGLTLKIDEFPVRVFSVYGPNDNNRSFFDNLRNLLAVDSPIPVIIGGDWNATYSCDDIGTNIDTYRMISPPSITRSLWLNELCRDLQLCDPFRAMHPSLRDFTFTPNNERRNRSRIDFFLLGDELIQSVSKSWISPNLGTLQFDHKSVFIDFKTDKLKCKMFINRTIIANPRTEDVVAAAAADTYLAHATPRQPDPREGPQHVFNIAGEDPIEGQKVVVGQLLSAINNYNNKKHQIETETY